MSAQTALITQLYVGYFNRAPDPDGLAYWTGQLQSGMSAVSIADNFSRQTEATSVYSFLSNPVNTSADGFLNAVYSNLFNRAPDAAGLAYWKGELAAGKPVGRMIVDIVSGAQGGDRTVVDNKVAAARSYVDGLGPVPGESFRVDDARRAVAGVGASNPSVIQTDQALQNLGAGNGLTITILDASGTLAPYETGIRQSVSAAWDMWAVHFTRTAPIEIEITFQRSDPGVLAFAGSLVELYTGEIFNGRRVTQTGVGVELQTGRDPNGSTADGRITIATDPSRLVFRDSVDDPMPRDKFDALSIFAHEFGHVLGFRSALDSNGRPLQTGFVTNYDRYVSGVEANSLNFLGPQAVQAKGGAIALANSGPAHLGTSGDLMATSLGIGQTKVVGVLDIAVLHDLGLPVSLAAFTGFA
ncbi:MAG: DUF4214 domain-containing protein [Alphaproteobacteria bacterium]|nr:DUF4214 domain-containing protein [Alphaproteobacteria bacterium]